MSIKGFLTQNGEERYDYNALDNKLELHDIILDRACIAEQWGGCGANFPSRDWEKRADGTFWTKLYNEFEIIPGTPILDFQSIYPFAPGVNSASIVPTDGDGGIELAEAIVGTLDIDISGSVCHEEGIYFWINSTDETVEKMNEHGYETYWFAADIYVEGRWRE